MKKDKVKTEFTETWYFPLLIFFGVPAGIVFHSSGEDDTFSFKTKLIILVCFYFFSFMVSLLYACLENLQDAKKDIKLLMLGSLLSPFIFLYCLKEIFVRIVDRIKGAI